MPQVIYLPSVYDPKKVREGILEIFNMVEDWRQKSTTENQDKKEVS